MKNIPKYIGDAFYCFYFNKNKRAYNLYLFIDYFSKDVDKYIVVYDRKNIPIKFGYDKTEKTTSSYVKLKNKDTIFKLTKKDLK